MLTDEVIDGFIEDAKERFWLTDIGEPGGMHGGMAQISGAVLVADLIAIIEELRAER
jgi:hypothetical protein